MGHQGARERAIAAWDQDRATEASAALARWVDLYAIVLFTAQSSDALTS